MLKRSKEDDDVGKADGLEHILK